MAAQEAGVGLILWMGDAASAMQFDGLSTAADAEWRVTVVGPMPEFGPGSRHPAIEDRLIVNACSRQVGAACVQHVMIPQRPACDELTHERVAFQLSAVNGAS